MSWGHQQSSWEGEVDGAALWIKKLPKPLGVMTGNDPRGIQLLDACRRAGVAVPEEVAVVGVDNDELVCELAYPPLSSVVPDAVRIGYEAAALLDRLMKGEPAPAAMQTIPPEGLAIRQSSDVTAIADPRLADALRFIREHACDGIGVNDVLDHLAVSRSVLQRLFRKHFDRTILDTITGVRIARVKQLLTETDMPLADIARRAGFSYMEYLSSTFRRQTGWTLSAFRRSSPDSTDPDGSPGRRGNLIALTGFLRTALYRDSQAMITIRRSVLYSAMVALFVAEGRTEAADRPTWTHLSSKTGRPAGTRHIDPADGLPGARCQQGRAQ